jgi:hypothetical protein
MAEVQVQRTAQDQGVAEEASARYGWPLHIIENCNDDPPVEQPEALLRALGAPRGAG